MSEYNCCVKCGVNNAERHHIIFKSAAKYMEFIPINIVYLCGEHHRANNSPHKSKKVDLKLKIDLQNKLETMFINKFYSREEIKTLLRCTDKDITLILKKLTLYRMGYEREQLLRRLLGGRMY